MRARTIFIVAIAAAMSLGAAALCADDIPQSVTVSFGRGLNTAQPGNPPNHHILPGVIKVRTGGVVNFVVSGTHWIRVYNPGTKVSDINLNSPDGTALLINDSLNLFYDGINPGGPTGAPGVFFPRSNAQNRTEAVSFPTAGTYLVICNLRPHFLDGMYAFIKVIDATDNDVLENDPDNSSTLSMSAHMHH
ncbi:MAG TPA: hypothetical protein VF980_03420 [Thermoanaerobaculia bacterium]